MVVLSSLRTTSPDVPWNSQHVAFVTGLGANIFVSSDGLLKLGDFGSSIKLKNPLQTIYGEISNIRGTVGE